MSKARRIVITHVHKLDGYYPDRDQIIGAIGDFEPMSPSWGPEGYVAGDFVPDKTIDAFGDSNSAVFFGIRYKRI